MLLRGRIKSVSKKQYTGSSRVHGRSLRNLASPSFTLVFIVVLISLIHSIFIRRIKYDLVILTVHIDDILLTESDSAGLIETKEYLRRYFVRKDIENLNTFLRLILHIKNIVYFFLNGSIL